MKLGNSFLNHKFRLDILIRLLIASIIISLFITLISCTITPKKVKTEEVSFDNNIQNSGFLGFYAGYGILTSNKLSEYNLLIIRYGSNTNLFIKKIEPYFGIFPYTNNTCLITKEGLDYFLQMKSLFRNGQ